MLTRGMLPDQIPQWAGGTNPGVNVKDYLDRYVLRFHAVNSVPWPDFVCAPRAVTGA